MALTTKLLLVAEEPVGEIAEEAEEDAAEEPAKERFFEEFYTDVASEVTYAPTQEECEEKLAELILQTKAEIAKLRSGKAMEYPDGISAKKKQLAAYLKENPGVSNKSFIAQQLGMDRTTVRRYYDEICAELAAPVPSPDAMHNQR